MVNDEDEDDEEEREKRGGVILSSSLVGVATQKPTKCPMRTGQVGNRRSKHREFEMEKSNPEQKKNSLRSLIYSFTNRDSN